MIAEWGKRVEGVGADILVQPPNASIFFAFSSAVMQESLGERIGNLPGVDEVAPTIILTRSEKPDHHLRNRLQALQRTEPGIYFSRRTSVPGPGRSYGRRHRGANRHLKVGDTVTLLNHPFKISGIVAHGKGARFFIPLDTGQDVVGADKKVSMFFVRSKGDTEGTRAEILKIDPLNRVRSMSEYVSLMNSSNLPELKPFIRTMVGLGIVISFLVVLLNMHTMVLERTREIGILKALGFSRFDVVRMLLGETAFLTLAGSLAGIVVTLITQAVLKQTNPGLSILLTPGWIAGAVGLALLGAAAGAAVPALRASSYDPVDALAYE